MACVIVEGFLQKQSGGLFLKQKRKWAVLRADGTLSLSKKPELPASSVIHIYELDDVVYRDEDCSISFSSVYNGDILKAYKFYALETPTFEDWTIALDKVRGEPSSEYTSGRSRYVRETLSAYRKSDVSIDDDVSLDTCGVKHSLCTSPQHGLDLPIPPIPQRATITDEELEKQVDPVLLIQSSGEPISMSGYIKKRGGAYGGNTSYKKRFFVLTIFGRVVYFADHKKTQALGQFSLQHATIQHVKQNEISVVTPTRVWFLKFESEDSRNEWTQKLEAITNFTTSTSPPLSPTKISSSTQDLQRQSSAEFDTPRPKFRRNVSLLKKQRSFIDGLGFSLLTDKGNESTHDLSSTVVSAVKEDASVSVACVTWNLSESLPKMQQCRFLRQYRNQQIVVVGVQECQSVMYHSFSSRQLSPLDIWLAMVKSLMGDPFTLVASRAMGAIHVCVFVREDVIGRISDVNTAFVPCGLGNVMYNKGAVAVSMKCNQISFGFVCAHLAANQEKTTERNQDFHRIAQLVVDQLGKVASRERRKSMVAVDNKTHHHAGLFVVVDDGEEDTYDDHDAGGSHSLNLNRSLNQSGRFQAVLGPGASGAQADSVDSLAREFDRCFFMGDLNYRVDAGKDWIEHYLKMAEMMRQQEKEAALQKATQSSTPDVDIVEVPEDVTVVVEDLDDLDRKSEKKIDEMLNLIQMGDYGTDDDDSDEESAGVKQNNQIETDPVLSVQNSSTDCLDAIDRVSLDNLRGPGLKKETSLTSSSSTKARVLTEQDLMALKSFKDETKLITSHSVFEFLLTYDQLCREHGKATVFRGFVEGPIQFKPSYKFDPFTEVYDTSRKGRSPAWCDRILYTPTHVALKHYRCIHGKFHSDHRAVVAIFTVKL